MKIISFTFLFILLITACFGKMIIRDTGGVIDLSGWDFRKQGTVEFIPVSGRDNFKYDKKTDVAFYSLTIILPEVKETGDLENLGIKVPSIGTEYYLWIDENIALSNNFNYFNRWSGEYYRQSPVVTFSSEKSNVNLTVAVKQFSYVRLIREPFLIGLDKQIRDQRIRNIFKEGMIISVFVLFSIINLFLWIKNKNPAAFLFLGLFSFIQAFNLTGRGESFQLLSFMNNEIYSDMQLFFLYSKLLLINAFLYSIFNNRFNLNILKIISIITAPLFFVFLFISMKYIFIFIAAYYLILFLTIVNYTVQAFILFRYERKKALLSVFVLIILLASYIIDIFNYQLYHFSVSIITYGNNSAIIYGFIVFTVTYTYYLFTLIKSEINNDAIPKNFASKFHLSQRETEVFLFLAKRYGYKEIANRLFISYKTVESHVYHIYQKTGVKNKEELINLIDSFQK